MWDVCICVRVGTCVCMCGRCECEYVCLCVCVCVCVWGVCIRVWRGTVHQAITLGCFASFLLVNRRWESRVTAGKRLGRATRQRGGGREPAPTPASEGAVAPPAAKETGLRSHLVSSGSCQASPHFKLFHCENQERKAGAKTQAPTHRP